MIILLFKGPGHKPSIIGVERCDPVHWTLFAIMFVFAFIMTAIAVWVQKHDYETKQLIRWQFTPCDFKYSLTSAIKFPAFAFISTFLAILCGFTPAFFYIPVLIMNELTNDMVIQTNAILSLYATGSATVLNFIFGRMPVDYFLMVVLFTAVGTMTGIYVQGIVKRKTGKTLFSMIGFNMVIVTCLIAIVAFQGSQMKQKVADGLSITSAPGWC